ncbi:hypothetical protein RJ47_14075 [Vibrio sinaloensis]|nr:hypothetical protein RJ47_14075 [Vibrio sinaloensis]
MNITYAKWRLEFFLDKKTQKKYKICCKKRSQYYFIEIMIVFCWLSSQKWRKNTIRVIKFQKSETFLSLNRP